MKKDVNEEFMKIYAVKNFDINKEKLCELSLLIDKEKRYKIEKFINKEDKIRTLIGEILVRVIINENLGITNNHITFEKNKYGKPCLKNYENFNFNISHSGDFIACVIDDKPVGIDIEKIKHIEYEDIAKSFFTINEYEYIIKNDPYTPLSKFYKIWTLKESYIKCCGQGLSIPLKSFSIDIDKNKSIKMLNDNNHNGYIFKSFDIDLHYKMAVCSLSKRISRNTIMIDQNSLINRYLDLI
ncbi:4'-phosphopantetheinyl transferase superfamily protein [Clostridium botulinum]|uniref:4'-phosphopantetheinyl transferase family protein n=1 Tax=Clostridium botulinum TaxID=1491 RepID=UPI0007E269FD|nr:4'-phosphopantetheinyl transferase superfamily protein [Clostridium botulinum]KEJ04026.1 4-phosphopantetheinyl transferase [Clostridium botulinum F 357]MBE1303701.1 4'-phosphopantetheinyl transferase superfamily protein [Clostridium botulinum]